MENISRLQRKILNNLLERDKGASLRWNDDRGVAAVLSGQLLPPTSIRNDLKENPEAVLKTFLKELGPLIGPKSSIGSMRFVKANNVKGDQVRIRAMQVAKGIPIHGASLVLYASAKRGIYRAQSGCYRDVEVPPMEYRDKPVDVKRRERKLRRRLLGILQDDKKGARFIKHKMKTGFGEDHIAEENFPLNAPPVHWLYPKDGKFLHVFRLNAYQPTKWLGVNGELTESIHMVDMVVDLVTGRMLHQGGPIGVWADVTADGRSTLQESGSYITRPLLAVREDMAERLLWRPGSGPSGPGAPSEARR